MKLSRLVLALSVPFPVALAAAEGVAVPEQPFAEVRKDLNDLKSPAPPALPRPGLDLGAAGIDAGARISAPPPALPAPAKTDPGVTPQRPASSGWLLDALEENSRRTGLNDTRPAAGRDDREADAERPVNSRPVTAAAGGRDPGSPDRSPGQSPLSAYLSAWLSPEEFRRLQSLYPDLATPIEGKDFSAGKAVPGRAAPGPETGDPRPGPGSFGELNRTPNNPNPYLAGLPALTRPTADAVGPLEQPRLATPVTAVPAAPEPVPVRSPAPVVPPAPGADDRKYFPQLKRF